MAFDGVTIANIIYELRKDLIGGRLYKIAQPEADELLLTIKTGDGQKRLFLSADASLPLVYLTSSNKPSPMTAPNFCMLLRKHLQNGRIINISQPGLERIIHIDIEHLNEMGDLCQKTLIIEIMGKHSNIIFCDDKFTIIDSIKHVSAAVSSVREVLPGKPYFIPQTQDKENLFDLDYDTFVAKITQKAQPVYKAVYSSLTGISPVLATQLCHEAGLESDWSTASLSESDLNTLYGKLTDLASHITAGVFSPNIAYDGKSPVEYAAIPLTIYTDNTKTFDSMSELLEHYYSEKNQLSRIRQKSVDLRKIVQTALERNIKKYDLQTAQMEDTKKRETYRIWGELLNAYGYNAPECAKNIEVLNYYTNEMITIPLDPSISPTDNAKKYFDKYSKLKRTYEALSQLTLEVHEEIQYLESVSTSLDIAQKEDDLIQIKEELIASGYIHKKGNSRKKEKFQSTPLHYISSDGFHMYVGKNNYQNDELTFKFATGNDWWFHAKGMPGSHVVVKMPKDAELPDRSFEEAGSLAAFYSKGRGQDKVEIDYTRKKNVKKPNAGKPGFVIYETNYSLMANCDISGLTQL